MKKYIFISFLVLTAICFVDCHFDTFVDLLESPKIIEDLQKWIMQQADSINRRAISHRFINNLVFCKAKISKRFLSYDSLLRYKNEAIPSKSFERICNHTIVAETICHKIAEWDIYSSVDVTNDTCCHNISQLDKLFKCLDFPFYLIGIMCLSLHLHSCFHFFADILFNCSSKNAPFSKFFSSLRARYNCLKIDSSYKREQLRRHQQDMEEDDLNQARDSADRERKHYFCRLNKVHFNQNHCTIPNRSIDLLLYQGNKHKDIHYSYCHGFCEITYKIQYLGKPRFKIQPLKQSIIKVSDGKKTYLVPDSSRGIVVTNVSRARTTFNFQINKINSYSDLSGICTNEEMINEMSVHRCDFGALETHLEYFKIIMSKLTNYQHFEYNIVELMLTVYIYFFLYVRTFIPFNKINHSSKIIMRKNKRRYRPMKNGPMVCWKKRSQSKKYNIILVTTKKFFSLFKKKNSLYILFMVNVFLRTMHIPLKMINKRLNITPAPEIDSLDDVNVTATPESVTENKKEDKENADDLWSTLRRADISAWARNNLTVYPVHRQSLDSFFIQSVQENLEEDRNAFRFEMIRLSTFRNFGVHIPISSLSLAKAGFYATGSSDECKCFSCGISYSNWREGDNPFYIHRQISRGCSFMNGSEDSNVCIEYSGESTYTHNADRNSLVCNGTSDTSSNITTNQSISNENVALQNGSMNKWAHGSTNTRNANRNPHVCNGTSETSPNMTLNQSTSNKNMVLQNGSMNTLTYHAANHVDHSQRRETVVGNTNNSAAQCSTPQRPSRNSPNHEMPNRRIEANRTSEQQSRNQTDNANGGANRNKYDRLGIHFDKPKYPSYAVLSVRVSSFQGWPSNIGQEPKYLALAGFFYAGYSDYCRCFFCGGGLRNWDIGDDPWVEHGRWFPKCAFVLQNKGEQFVSIALQKNSESEENHHLERSEADNKSRKELKKREICIQTVMEMGYTREVIDTAISELQDKGQENFDAPLLLETVFCLEERLKAADQQRSTEEENAEGATGFDGALSIDANTTYLDNIDKHIESVKLDDTEALVEENSRLRAQRLCRICREEDATVAFLPCGHLVCCYDCAPALVYCCVCKCLVRGTVKTWLV